MADGIDIALGPLMDLVDDDGDTLELRVGTLEGATDHEGEPIVPRAVGNHFGTATAPPRPYLQAAAEAHWDEWTQGVARLIADGASGREALEIVGELAATDIQLTIDNWQTPANSPKTIKNKRNPRNRQNDPLVDWGDMRDAQSFQIVAKGSKGD